MSYILSESKLKSAFQKAIEEWAESPSNKTKQKNKIKSREWVKLLARNIRELISINNIVVFPDDRHADNNVYGKRKEFLFDIHVGLYSEYNSGVGLKKYISKSLLVAESEFSDNTRNAVEDLSKLLCCDSEIKIFIGPYNSLGKESKYLSAISEIINHNRVGILYIALVTHPKRISRNEKKWELYKVVNNDLKSLKLR